MQRENVLTVQILMQTVVVLRTILQQQGCRTVLTSGMATFEEGWKGFRKTLRQAHLFMPAIGDGHQSWVERAAQAGHKFRQRVAEILVLASAEPVASHHHVGAKQLGSRVQGADLLASLVAQQ
ncbi:hypothetical protein D3C84_670720 [compost metagenome]